MNRVRFAVAATLFSTCTCAGVALAAQAPPAQPPPMPSILAGKKFTPPVKGQALIEYTQPVTKALAGKSLVQTTVKVKNASTAPIARLQFTETWYDKAGAIVGANRSVINGLLQPGEIQTMTIETPYNPKMISNQWAFVHANGTVKVERVKSLEVPKEAATKPAASTKK